MSIRSLRDVPVARIALALVAVAAVVAANQTNESGRSSRVLGVKFERCAVDGSSGSTAVEVGNRLVVAAPLTVGIRGGRPGASLAPPVKISPLAEQQITPVAVALGIRAAGAKRVTVTMSVRNLSDCPVALSLGRITAARGSSPARVVPVRFGGSERMILKSGGRAIGRVVIPVETDGSWRVDGTTYADVGAAS